jgi:hypothetical protein
MCLVSSNFALTNFDFKNDPLRIFFVINNSITPRLILFCYYFNSKGTFESPQNPSPKTLGGVMEVEDKIYNSWGIM